MQCTNEYSYAGVVPRMMAYLIDSICVFIVGLSIGAISNIFEAFGMEDIANKGILFQYSIIAIIIYIVKKLYFVIFITFSGQTLGKMCFRIKVVNDNGDKVTFWNALYRETIGRYLSDLIPLLGYGGVFVDREKRAIHDMLCDTRVIYDTNINNEPIYKKRVYSPINTPQNANMVNNNGVQGGVMIGAAPQNMQNMNNGVMQPQNVQNMNNGVMQPQNVQNMNNGVVQLQNDQCMSNADDMLQRIQNDGDVNDVLQAIEEDVNEESIVNTEELVVRTGEAPQEDLVSEMEFDMSESEELEDDTILEETDAIMTNESEDDENNDSYDNVEENISKDNVENKEARREINKDIVSAYGKDLDYSTEIVIDEEDVNVSYDTSELDELLEKLNSKTKDK